MVGSVSEEYVSNVKAKFSKFFYWSVFWHLVCWYKVQLSNCFVHINIFNFGLKKCSFWYYFGNIQFYLLYFWRRRALVWSSLIDIPPSTNASIKRFHLLIFVIFENWISLRMKKFDCRNSKFSYLRLLRAT